MRWCRLVTEPSIPHRFRTHHRTPPLFGVFFEDYNWDEGHFFVPTLPSPDRIPPECLVSPQRSDGLLSFISCRHGLVLLINEKPLLAVVWDPVAGRRCCIAIPPEVSASATSYSHRYHGAVLWEFGSGTFKLVVLAFKGAGGQNWLASAWLYESGSGKWRKIISSVVPHSLVQPSVLVGNALCWVFTPGGGAILEFDIWTGRVWKYSRGQTTSVLPKNHSFTARSYASMSLAVLSNLRIQVWDRKAISDCCVRWVLQNTIELDKVISLSPLKTKAISIVGVDEDSDVILLRTVVGVFMINLQSLEFLKLPKDSWRRSYYPYRSFYSAGCCIDGGADATQMFNNSSGTSCLPVVRR